MTRAGVALQAEWFGQVPLEARLRRVLQWGNEVGQHEGI